ncbi:hypothetical protein JOF56_005463 [Kibdelosporangium banguiense]|uniref:Uncharacterized protein n=1 Tax=Kibdelosporangium banguiense TaxID=1365924 RepID=A0ABS4TKY7_9PSEU|nr:hypothetical protein [Kibdelosporangium banguiense]
MLPGGNGHRLMATDLTKVLQLRLLDETVAGLLAGQFD